MGSGICLNLVLRSFRSRFRPPMSRRPVTDFGCGRDRQGARSSAVGYKPTFQGVSQNVRFTPESRHSNGETPTVTSGCPLYPQ